jgi:haloalkane dehalogenase
MMERAITWPSGVTSHRVQVDGLDLHYLEAGAGEPVLLLHGWPTSAFLWRNVMPLMAPRCRVIALDLPGFGASAKPLDVSYSFRFHEWVLDGFLDALGIESTGLAVHDLGGPVGLYWAIHHPERVSKLALLNTLVYPNPSWAVVAFVLACRLPLLRWLLASSWGLRLAMRIGVTDAAVLTDEVMHGVLAPFATSDAQEALLRAGTGLNPKGFTDIAERLSSLRVPVRIVYGANDRILPDVAATMARVAEDLPQSEVSELPDCGHFLQEERPEEVGRLLRDFFAPARSERTSGSA